MKTTVIPLKKVPFSCGIKLEPRGLVWHIPMVDAREHKSTVTGIVTRTILVRDTMGNEKWLDWNTPVWALREIEV